VTPRKVLGARKKREGEWLSGGRKGEKVPNQKKRKEDYRDPFAQTKKKKGGNAELATERNQEKVEEKKRLTRREKNVLMP